MGEKSTTVKRRRWFRRESNPLLVKELRGRMRGARAFVVLTVYLLLLSCFTSVIYYAYAASARGPGGGPDMAYLGKTMFASVVIIEIFMVTFITPAFTAGAISGERERQTYELLRTTLLTAPKLVFGKLSSALTYMFLLIMAAVPLESLAFVLGGVVVTELAVALVILLVTAFAFAVIGILFSSFLRTTLASTVLSYITALMLTIGLPVLMLIAVSLLGSVTYGFDKLSWAAEAALLYLVVFIASLSPISAAIASEIMLTEENAILFFWYDIDPTHRIPIPSFWIVYTLIYLALAAVLLLITILRVRRQEQR
ncbi:MAG: ABC transporter permease subunit [Chloroflexi bacterium]|nr:ABC transporter permease subunit [Chloroflexota bacterium]